MISADISDKDYYMNVHKAVAAEFFVQVRIRMYTTVSMLLSI